MLKKVLPTGPLNAAIMIVGEAPGAEEELHGKPFVGTCGWELDRMLRGAGIFREQCYITNVCNYRPQFNDISVWIKTKQEGILPLTKFNDRYAAPQVTEGIRDLEAAIRRVNPAVIIALGNTPLWALTGEFGVTNWRGSILPCTLVEGPKVIPTFHPSFVLRSYADRVDTIADLRRAEQESHFREIRMPNWKFHLQPTLSEVMKYLNDLPQEVVCDIETGGRQIKCIGIGRSQTEAMCIPITSIDRGGSYWSAADEIAVIGAIRRAFEKRKVINQNMLYDSFYLAWRWGIKVIPSFDTMIAQGVLFPGRPKSLDYLASLHCEFYRYWKHDYKNWEGYQRDSDLWYYNCQDCVYTWEVAASLRNAIAQSVLQEQLDFEMSLFEPILHMMLRGVNSAPELRADMSFRLDVAIQKRWSELEKIFGHKVNPNSPKQLSTLFYTDLKIPAILNRKTKAPTTDDSALAKIAEKEPLLIPVTKRLAESRSLRLVKSNFVDIETPDGRLYTSYNPVGTITFRFNSSSNPMGYGTNLQNVMHMEEDDMDAYPSDMPNVRELFLPDPGYVLAEFDLSKADLRVVVWESEENELKQMLNKGVNIYKEVGTKVTGMPYRKAKMFLHGTNYGGSANTMARNCGITRHQAEVAQRRWFEAYPGIHRWHKRVEQQLLITRTTSNRFGFRIMYFDRPEGLLPEALAWTPQSTVAIVINKVLRQIYDRYEATHDNNVQLLMQVHDSVVTQIRREAFHYSVATIFSFFNNVVVPYQDPLIIPADCKVGVTNWAHMEKYHVNMSLTTPSTLEVTNEATR
jgi:DNA polymerase